MLARKSLLLFTVNMAGSVLGFLSTIVIARWMGAAALGTVGYLLGLLGLLAVLLDMGSGLAHLKRVSETDQDPAPLIGTFLVLRVALTALFLIAVLLLPLIKNYLGQPLFSSRDEQYAYYIIAAFYVLHGLANVFLYTFEARLETAKETIPDFAGSLLSFVAKVVVASCGLGVIALSGAYLVEQVTRLFMALLLFTGYHIARVKREHVLGYIRYTVPLTLNTALSLIVANVNPVLIRAFWTTGEVGYYTAVLGFGAVLDRVASTLMVLFFPQASSDAAQGRWDEIRRRFLLIERYMLTVLVPFGVALVFFSSAIVTAALGGEFASATPILILLAINSILAGIFQPYRAVLCAVEKQGYLVVSSVLGLTALLIVDLLLVPRQISGFSLSGLAGTGAAIALLAMTMTGGIVQVIAVKRHVGIGLYRQAAWHLLAGAIMYVVMHIGGRLVPEPFWVKLPVCAASGFGVYIIALVLLRQFSYADAKVFINVFQPRRMAEYISAELDRRSP
jgi:O-antigen/teichoic acid export membrane protein